MSGLIRGIIVYHVNIVKIYTVERHNLNKVFGNPILLRGRLIQRAKVGMNSRPLANALGSLGDTMNLSALTKLILKLAH